MVAVTIWEVVIIRQMARYEVYKYDFEVAKEMDMFSTADGSINFEKAQDVFHHILKEKIPTRKKTKDNVFVPLENSIIADKDGVLVMVLCNLKNNYYLEGKTREKQEYHPGGYVIIDNRKDVCQMIIEKSTSFDSDTRKVREFLQDAIDRALGPQKLKINIRQKYRAGEFWDVIHQQEAAGDMIYNVRYKFPRNESGPVDNSISRNNALNGIHILAAAMNAGKGELRYDSEGCNIIRLDKENEDIAETVRLCSQNGYEIAVKFKHYGLYEAGKDVKFVYDLKDEVIDDFTGVNKLIGFEMGAPLLNWLDKIREQSEECTYEIPKAIRR